MVYDACEYEYQINEIYRRHRKNDDLKGYRERKSRIKETDTLLPVVTVVLYLGEGHWEGRRHLSELFQLLSETDRGHLGTRLHDHDLLILEADHVNPKEYETDLRQFFKAMQCRRDKKKLRCLLKSNDFKNLLPETELAIAAHLNVKKLFRRMEKERMPMCKAFDDLMREERLNGKREGKREGIREGEKAGKKKERFQIIKKMYGKGMEETLIRELTGCTKKEFASAVGR